MKANELRIGSWYLSTKFQVPVICEMGDMYEIYMRAEGATEYNVDDIFQPIQLTEEWLMKFGFSHKAYKSPINTAIYYLSELDIDYCFYYADFREDYGFYVEYTDSPFAQDANVLYPVSFGIKYVHQLQNLYFALTGEELTVVK